LKDTKFLITYFLGFLIIVMFAKDKFNMPIFDKQTIGPFAQLPPQSLTIDSRYQFAELSILPSWSPSTRRFALSVPRHLIWTLERRRLRLALRRVPNMAGRCGNLLDFYRGGQGQFAVGTIELSIRQYAHKTAYIPTAVNDLAFSCAITGLIYG